MFVEVQFTPEQQAKLLRMAEARGLTAEALVQEAVERLLTTSGFHVKSIRVLPRLIEASWSNMMPFAK
jgi:hypothetical protein